MILFVILISVGITSAYAINITLGGTVDITEILNMMENRIINVGTPTADTDAATKGYVDQASSSDTLAGLGCTTDQIAKFGESKMFVVGLNGDDVNEYTLGSAFDISTASFVDSFSVAGQETLPSVLAFSSDGTKMFVVGFDGGDVNEYTLTTAFDVSTASFVDSFSVAAVATGLAFSSDGAKMFVVDGDGDDINEYTLTTPFDVSTASFADSFSVAAQETNPYGVAFSTVDVWFCSDDTKFCSNNTSQAGIWCIDNSVRSAAGITAAGLDCYDEGMIVTPLKALIACDRLNLSTSDCDAKTDPGGSVQLWTSDIAHRDSVVSETFSDNIITYKNDNTVDEVDATGLSFEYFCAKPLS